LLQVAYKNATAVAFNSV